MYINSCVKVYVFSMLIPPQNESSLTAAIDVFLARGF